MFFRFAIWTLCIVGVGFSQSTIIYHNEYSDYREALSLYEAHKYKIAQKFFVKAKSSTDNREIKDNSSYYIALCALKVDDNSEKFMTEFVNRFPVSPKRFDAYYNFGEYYFYRNDFEKSLIWYKKAGNCDKFLKDPKFNFRIGYCYFEQQKYISAKKYMLRLIKNREYRSKARYYLGFIAYHNNDYDTAEKYFSQIRQDPFAHDKLMYYELYIGFASHNYKKSIELGSTYLEKIKDSTEISQVNKIIGESYFKTKKYKEAVEFLSKYEGKWRNEDYYQMGYAYYKQKDYERAVDYFNKIIGKQNKLLQNAYYHLGDCYFRLNEKAKALNAFTKASHMDFNEQIQSDAWFNRAVISYDIGGLYQNSVVVLDSFVKKYPTSPYKMEIGELLANSLLLSKDFDKALEIINQNWKFNNNTEKLYQKVNYFKGLELFKNENYLESIPYFNTVAASATDSIYYLNSKYYEGEAYHQSGEYKKSLDIFQNIRAEIKTDKSSRKGILSNRINYDIGYCYFELNRFEEAGFFFQMFIKASPDSYERVDAIARLADCSTANRQFYEAIANYDRVVASKNYEHRDYAVFRRAMCLGSIDKHQQKIRELYKFTEDYKQSAYIDDAYMEIGDTFKKLKQYRKSIDAYEMLKREIPYSPLYSKALLSQASVYNIMGKPYKAIDIYKRVVADFPRTRESAEAVGLTKSIYIGQNDLKNYVSWIKKIDFDINVDYGMETRDFKNAKQQYISLRKTESLIAYINTYPKGIYTDEARYIVAQSKFTNRDIEAAIPYFKAIVEDHPSRFTERSLYALGKYYFDKGDYSTAMKYLSSVIKTSKIVEHKVYAYLKIGTIAYDSEQYQESENNIKKAIKLTKSDDKLLEESQLVLGKIYLKTGRESVGMRLINKTSQSRYDYIAGEAFYQKAYYQFSEKHHEDSNETLLTITKRFPQLKRLCGKSLLLSAKNYIVLGDRFQAVFALENIIENYADYDPILVSEAVAYLKKQRGE